MSSASTPAESLWTYSTSYHDEFAEEHDVYPEFLPFADLSRDRIELLTDLTEFLTTRPAHCRSVSRTQLLHAPSENIDNTGGRLVNLDRICLLHGWWPCGEGSPSGTHYANPEYVHPQTQTHVTDRNGRRELFEQATRLGIVEPTQILPALGVRSSKPSRDVDIMARRCGIEWGAERARGRERMARTWATIAHWDYSQYEIADAFGVCQSEVGRWIRKYAPDFEPPDDPTNTTTEDST